MIRLPSRLLFLAGHTARRNLPGNHGWEEESLIFACGLSLQRITGQWCRKAVHSLQSTQELHELILRQSSRKQTLHVYTYQAGRMLGVADWWSRIRDGLYSLGGAGVAEAVNEPDRQPRKRRWIGAAVLTDPPTFLRLRSAHGVIEICDSANYLRVSPQELASGLGVRKHALPPEMGEADHEFGQLVYEVRAVAAFICGLIDRWAVGQYGPWRGTAASLAWGSFKSGFGGRVMWPCKDDEVKQIERCAYYGGLNETYWTGRIRAHTPPADEYYGDPDLDREPFLTGPVTLVDMRSAYGWAMLATPTPISLEAVYESPSVDQLASWVGRYGMVAVVRVHSETEAYPVRRRGHTVQAVGDYWTCLAGVELEQAIAEQHVTKVAVCLRYKLGRTCAQYARHWLSLRSKAEAAEDRVGVMLAKMMLNSLYGRFAIMTPRWVLDPKLPIKHRWGNAYVCDLQSGRIIPVRSIGGIGQRQEGYREHPQSFPAVAAFITASIRARMRAMRQICGSTSVLLIRTDSMLLLTSGLARLKDSGSIGPEHGQMRVVTGPTNDCTIYSVDQFTVGAHIVRVGVNLDGREVSPGVWMCERREKAEFALSRPTEPTARVRTVAVRLAGLPVEHGQGFHGWHPPVRLESEPDAPPPSVLEMSGIRSLQAVRESRVAAAADADGGLFGPDCP